MGRGSGCERVGCERAGRDIGREREWGGERVVCEEGVGVRGEGESRV